MCALVKRVRKVSNSIFSKDKPVYDITGKLIGYEESDEHYNHRKKILLKLKLKK